MLVQLYNDVSCLDIFDFVDHLTRWRNTKHCNSTAAKNGRHSSCFRVRPIKTTEAKSKKSGKETSRSNSHRECIIQDSCLITAWIWRSRLNSVSRIFLGTLLVGTIFITNKNLPMRRCEYYSRNNETGKFCCIEGGCWRQSCPSIIRLL